MNNWGFELMMIAALIAAYFIKEYYNLSNYIYVGMILLFAFMFSEKL